MRRLLAIALVLLAGLLLGLNQSALAADTLSGAQVFSVHCAGCHLNGGNIIRRGKNLKLKALQRNGYDSVEAIAQIITNGKNNMSAYRDRLTEQEIRDVATYVLEQAEQGWRG
ncbi:MAG: c-type cytochrome [Cyanobacteria bacterium CRU_2_1]|nr:c-type cytochrome [Cyanobacteria bacterium CRU_2_1]